MLVMQQHLIGVQQKQYYVNLLAKRGNLTLDEAYHNNQVKTLELLWVIDQIGSTRNEYKHKYDCILLRI